MYRLENIEASDLPVRVGRYTLEKVLGRGGMARVFRATLHGPGGFRKPVALKVLHSASGDANPPQAIGDLIREARLGGLLRHPNIVDVYELGHVDGNHFISMELVEGLTLRQLLHEGYLPPPSVLIEIGIAVAVGLEKAHALKTGGRPTGLVHCDLKPSNVILSWDGAVKIADFGMAFTETAFNKDARGPGIHGTPAYMAPEQVLGDPLDGRTDVFSLGLVLTELGTAHRVFDRSGLLDEDFSQLVLLEESFLTENAYEELQKRTEGLGDVLRTCLCLEPDGRPRDVSTLCESLETLAAKSGRSPSLRHWIRKVYERMGLRERDDALVLPPRPAAGKQEALATHRLTPLNTLTNIGISRDPFIGRQAEIQQVSDLISQGARLITLKGMGGTGKTRLSRTMAQLQVRLYSGGAWFVDLTEARTAVEVVRIVGSVLQIPLIDDSQSSNLVNQIGRVLSGRKDVLMVLDNFEQVVEEGASIVAAWMEQAPQAVFLVTSREPLRIMGEQVLELSPLDLKEGVNLFRVRATAAGATWEDSEANRDAVEALVRRVEGIPLAIEMAATRSVQLGPQILLAKVGDHLSVLKSNRRDQHARQETLTSMIDWSWELLEPWQQVAMAQLSVFRGGFTMEAAEVVLDLSQWPDAPWSVDVVGSLLDKSLLRTWNDAGTPRFGMFWTVQEYASTKLADSGDAEPAKARHAAHYSTYGSVESVFAFSSHGGFSRLIALRVEIENLKAGLNTACAQGSGDVAAGCAVAAQEALSGSGFSHRSLALLEQANAVDVMSDIARGRLACRCATLTRRNTGDYGQVDVLLQVGEEMAVRTGDSMLAASVGMERGLSLVFQGLMTDAFAVLKGTLDQIEDGDIPHLKCTIQRSLSTVASKLGRKAEALELLDAARISAESRGSERQCVVLYSVIGGLYREWGQLDAAQEWYVAALALARQLGLRSVEGVVLGNLANLYFTRERYEESRGRYELALEIAREMGNRRSEAINLGNLGSLYLKLGDLEKAEHFLEAAIPLGEPIQSASAGAFKASLALIRAQQGDMREARELLSQGESALRGIDAGELGLLLCIRTQVELLDDKRACAEKALIEAEEILANTGVSPQSELGRATQTLRQSLAPKPLSDL